MKLANALAKLIQTTPGWTYRIDKQGTVPACFELERDGKRQQILLGELGPALLPSIFRPIDRSPIGADQFAGAIMQLRIKAPHLRGYQSSSFKIDERDIDGALDRIIRPILEGRKRWQGREHEEVVPGSFVYYCENCPHCKMDYLRIAHLLIGNPKHPKTMPAKVISDEWQWFSPALAQADKLEDRVGLPLGPLSGGAGNGFYPDNPIQQTCHHCGVPAPKTLVSSDEALKGWPGRSADFRFRLPVPGQGWGRATSWVERVPGDQAAWDALLADRRRERESTRQALRQQKEAQALELRRQDAEWRARLEEDRQRREAEAQERLEEEQRRQEAVKQRDAEERRVQQEIAADGRRQELRVLAERRIKRADLRGLWLTTSQPRLRDSIGATARTPLDLAGQSKEGLARAKALLLETKF